MGDKQTPGTMARCCWEVTAGLIPGQPMQELTRRWVITSEWWDDIQKLSDEEFAKVYPNAQTVYMQFQFEAHEYARSLTDPGSLNWVRVEWIWF